MVRSKGELNLSILTEGQVFPKEGVRKRAGVFCQVPEGCTV